MSNIKIIRKLGEGGNCTAFQGMDLDTDSFVTIKKIKSGAEKMSGERLESMDNEALILSELDHTGIPRLIQKNKDMIVLEHIQGMSLEKYMSLYGLFKEKKVAMIALELAEILRYLHGRRRPVIYRDLKPSNIILKPDGHIALIDFGAARFYDFKNRCDTKNIGTLGFAAPEQFGNLGQTDPRTDIYCFGMTLLKLLTGVDPRDGEEIAELKQYGVKGVSDELMKIIDKCTRPDREDRFRSVQELQEQLKRYPGKLLRKRILGNFRIVAAAAAISLAITASFYYADTVKAIASEDVSKRLPFVKERLGIAHMRIENFLEENLGVEIK